MNHSKYPPKKPERYRLAFVDKECITMAIYLNGLPMIVDIWADESETLCMDGARISQIMRIRKIIAPMDMIDTNFFCMLPKRSLGMANRRRHNGA